MGSDTTVSYLDILLEEDVNDNLSYNRSATQTLTWFCTDTCKDYTADNAVDGDMTSCTKTKVIRPFTYSENVVKWYVDLGSILSIYNVRIQFKGYGSTELDRQRGRFAGFSLFVSNTSEIGDGYACYNNKTEIPPLDFTTTCFKHARFVIYLNERFPRTNYPVGYQEDSYTELCEVTVKGCKSSGVFGSNCSLPCPVNCQEQRCHIVNGTCLGCASGWKGTFCNQKCMHGFYGLECSSHCSEHCVHNQSCNHIDGKCINGCAAGWEDERCDRACSQGRYGENCAINCSGNCLNNKPCDGVTGVCDTGCEPGFSGDLCATECESGFYGGKCAKQCNINCNGSCDHVSGDCKSGCKAGYLGLKCNDVCNQSWYWHNCSKRCNINCFNQSCHHTTGTCDLGCTPGWMGSFCSSECKIGFYGRKCEEECNVNCNGSCDHVTGYCNSGCKAGYLGSKCDKVCDHSWYWYNCSKRCDMKCVNQSCRNTDGTCDQGCTPGWRGSNCSQACISGTFGKDCRERCSGHCLKNESCNHVTGICENGCSAGHHGSFCNLTCTDGYFGVNCMNACSQNCSHACDKIDGFCVCLPGRTGAPTCNKECPLGFYGANCASTCSKHCDFNDTCDRQNGSCPRGCQDHYHGDTCKQNHTEYVAANQNQDVDSDYQMVGLYASVGLNFVLIGVTFLLIRSSLQKRLSNSSEKTCDKEAYVSTLGSANEYQELDLIDSSLPYQEVEFSSRGQFEPL